MGRADPIGSGYRLLTLPLAEWRQILQPLKIADYAPHNRWSVLPFCAP